jgi:hypothetical protein
VSTECVWTTAAAVPFHSDREKKSLAAETARNPRTPNGGDYWIVSRERLQWYFGVKSICLSLFSTYNNNQSFPTTCPMRFAIFDHLKCLDFSFATFWQRYPLDAHDLQGSCPSCAPSLANLIYVLLTSFALSLYTRSFYFWRIYKILYSSSSSSKETVWKRDRMFHNKKDIVANDV